VNPDGSPTELVQIDAPLPCENGAWEEAYRRFETPAQEVAKFRNRLQALGAQQWSRGDQAVELFCGRGGGLLALAELGFTRLEGLDLSATLLQQYRGPAKLYVCDCRRLPFDDASRDLMIVQGGLHHLQRLPDDLEACLDEVRRVLRPGGRFVVVEPWTTPFLTMVHTLAFSPLRKAWGKLDALATMIEHERDTYENWLRRPAEILAALDRRFTSKIRRQGWGKLSYVGLRTEAPASG
jgi:ubiquinone/menaquinone biosynthesis C-methylase UbiE